MNITKEKISIVAIAVVSIVITVKVFLVEPVAQDQLYHLFKDQRTFMGVPNFWNVISNIPFLLVGIMGLDGIFRTKKIQLVDNLKPAYITYFVGVSLVAFGSAYYHLSPSNDSLLWDRLPMTIAFMALFSIIMGEFISTNFAKLMLWPLLIIGAFSVFYWSYTETKGAGDLRLYFLVQFLPMLIIPLILLFLTSIFTKTTGYWLLLCAYLLAKVLEYFDGDIYDLLPLLSGHSLKHLVAALGILFLLQSYRNRELV